jgi:XTP/dITP diphosphohydrolase
VSSNSTPHKLLLATRNKGKIEEFRRILEDIAAGQIELVGLDQFPNLHDVDETGSTFEENALLKAREMCEASGIPAIADDSGLCVDYLNGDPGIFSARWAGSHGDDKANTAKVLASLVDVPDEKRSAHFTCVAALALPDGVPMLKKQNSKVGFCVSRLGIRVLATIQFSAPTDTQYLAHK